MTVYMAVSKDRFELPIAIADSAVELARMLGVNEHTVYKSVWLAETKGKYSKYLRLELNEEE